MIVHLSCMYCILYMYIISIQLHYDTPYYVVHVYKVLVGNFAHLRQESQRQRSSQEVSWFMVVYTFRIYTCK